MTGGIVLVKDGDPLSGDEPVAWRETTKKSLGTFRYLFRVLVVLELPLLFICQILQTERAGRAGLDADLDISSTSCGVLAAAMIVVHAGSVISSERTRQTLDVLLTTPLSGGAEFSAEAAGGAAADSDVLLVPFLTIFLFESWWNQSHDFRWLYLPLELIVAGGLPAADRLARPVGRPESSLADQSRADRASR